MSKNRGSRGAWALRIGLVSILCGTVLAGCATWSGPRARAAQARRAAMIADAERGAPYRYGGATPHGFDCSGLVYYSYRRAHIRLPRTARRLSEIGRPVGRSHLHRGDLVFFYEGGKPYGHVGIYVGRGHFVHAPAPGQRVRLDSLHNPYWAHHFAGARSLW